MKRFLIAAPFFAILIYLWHFVFVEGIWSAVLVLDPFEVWRYLVRSAADGTLIDALMVTMRRLLIGFIARFHWARDTIGVLALGLRTLPSVCWVPLALLWFGQTEAAMLFVVIMGTFWSVVISTDNGVRNAPPNYSRAAPTMGADGLDRWINVVPPASLPFVGGGVKQSWAFAWCSLMAAEIYVTVLTGVGLGNLLYYGRELHTVDRVIAVMLIIVLIGLLADKILFSPWERFLHRRWGTARG